MFAFQLPHSPGSYNPACRSSITIAGELTPNVWQKQTEKKKTLNLDLNNVLPVDVYQ